MSQDNADEVLHQREHEAVIGERLDGVTAENVAIATPASPGATYVQAEVVALHSDPLVRSMQWHGRPDGRRSAD